MEKVVSGRLETYMNARVTVQYGGQAIGYSDTGIISFMDPQWIELVKDKGEVFLIPISAIRFIRMIDPPRLQGESVTLLRASTITSQDSQEQRLLEHEE